MITVTTPTGHIGSEVVTQLLAAGEAVRVVVRDPARLAAEVAGRVDVVTGSTDDQSVLDRALQGAESLFWVVPPSFTTNDDRAYYLHFTDAACRAVQSQGVRRVVAVSALGRNFPMEAGVVSATHAADEAFEATGVAFRALWCPSFFENMLNLVGALKHQGAFFLPIDGDRKTRHAATRDIGASGARLLLDRTWTGQGGLAVLGPEDLSMNDIAGIMTEVLEKPIRFQQVPADAYKAALLQHGASEHFAQSLATMYAAKNSGLDEAEPRTAENTTPTTFRQWCEEVLKPAFLA